MTLELTLLQLLRFKGRAKPDGLAASLGQDEDVCTDVLRAAVDAGHCVEAGAGLRLTTDGRARLTALGAAERAAVDGDRLRALYDEFCTHNTTLKAIVTAWQLRDDGAVNDHTDAAYDAEIVARLRSLHDGFTGTLRRIVDVAPRLDHYPARFGRAVDHVLAGDHTYVARPVQDSYHTVWFELHEELIGLLGLSREQEAAAGRAR